MKRENIDNFLINLDKFIEKYYEHEIYKDLITIFKANKHNITSLSNKKELFIPMLVNVCNVEKSYTPKKTIERLREKRTSIFVRKVGYKLKYKEVKDISYEHIFIKILINTNAMIALTFPLEKIYKGFLKGKDLKSFYIPEDWFHNDDIIIY